MANVAKLVIEAALDARGIYRGAQIAQSILAQLANKIERKGMIRDFFPVGIATKSASRAANAAIHQFRTMMDARKARLFEKAFDKNYTAAEIGKSLSNIDEQFKRRLGSLRYQLKQHKFFGASPAEQKQITDGIQRQLGMIRPHETQQIARSIFLAQQTVRRALARKAERDVGVKETLFRSAGTEKDIKDAAQAGALSAKAYNDQLIRGMDSLRRRGMLTPQTHAFIVNQFKRAGLDAGKAAAQSWRDQFVHRMRTFANSATGVGRDLTFALTLPLVGLAVAAFKVSMDYGLAMNRVQSYTNATAFTMKQMEAVALDLGRRTLFTTKDVADAFLTLTKAGFSTSAQMQVMKDVLHLAASGMMEMNEAADIATAIVQGYGIDLTRGTEATNEFHEAVNMLVKTFVSAKVELTDLGISFRYAGSIAKTAGMPFEETAAIMAVFARAGFRGSMAGTALRGAISRLIDPPRDAEKALRKLGVTTLDTATGKMLPMINILQQLKDAGASTADVLSIFGLRAGPAMSVLVDQGIEPLARLTAEIKNHGNIADRVAENLEKGLYGAWILLRSNAEYLAIIMGKEGLSGATEKLMRSTAGLFYWFAGLPKQVKLATMALLGLVGAMGPLLWMSGSLLKLFFILRTLGPGVAATIGIITGALIAVAVAFTLAWYASKKFREEQERLSKVQTVAREEAFGMSLKELKERRESLKREIEFRERLHFIAKQQFELEKKPLNIGSRDQTTRKPSETTRKNYEAASKALATAKAQLKGVNEALREKLKLDKANKDILKDLEAQLLLAQEELGGMLPGGTDGIDKTTDAWQKLREEVDAVLDRYRIMRELGADTAQVSADVIAKLQEVRGTIAGFGGGDFVEGLQNAPAALLDEFLKLLKGLQNIQTDPLENLIKQFDVYTELGWDAADMQQRLISEKDRLITQIKLEGAANEELVKQLAQVNDRINAFTFETPVKNIAAKLKEQLQKGGSIEYLQSLRKEAESMITWLESFIDLSDGLNPFEEWLQGLIEQLRGLVKEAGDKGIDSQNEKLNWWTKARAIAEGKAQKDLESRFMELAERAANLAIEFTNVEFILKDAALRVADKWVSLFEKIPTPAEMLAFIPSMPAGIMEKVFGPIVGLPTQVLADLFNALTPALEPLVPVFEAIGNIVANTLQPVFEAITPVLERLYPVIHAIFQVITPILTALVPLLDVVRIILEALFPIIKLAAIAFTYVAEVAFYLAGAILKIAGWITEGIGHFIRALGKFINILVPFANPGNALVKAGDSMIKSGKAAQEMGGALFESAKQMKKARDEIRDVEIGKLEPPVKRVADQMERLANLNVPEIFKLKLEQFRAITGDDLADVPWEVRSGQASVTGSGGASIVDNSITFTDGAIVIQGSEKTANQLYTEIVEVARLRSQNARGTTRVEGFV